MTTILLPLILLNSLAGIVGGVWLITLGYWELVLLGICLSISGALIVSVLLLPSMLLVAPLIGTGLANSKLVLVPLTALSVAYVYCVMGVWDIGIFSYFAKHVRADGAIPSALWSYAVDTGVWNYLAQKEAQAGNDSSTYSAFFNQIACIFLAVYVLGNYRFLDVYEMASWFSIPMLFSLFLQVIYVAIMRPQQY